METRWKQLLAIVVVLCLSQLRPWRNTTGLHTTTTTTTTTNKRIRTMRQHSATTSNSNTSDQQQPYYFVYVMGRSGMGSQIMNLVAQAVYFAETQHRILLNIDESTYQQHRHNASVGLFRAHFDLFNNNNNISLMETESDYDCLQQRLRPGLDYRVERQRAVTNKHEQTLLHEHPLEPLYVTSTFSLRNTIMRYYNIRMIKSLPWLPTAWTGSQRFYDAVSAFMCPRFQFNKETRIEIDQRFGGLAELFAKRTNQTTSVSFHLRRGDKVGTGPWTVKGLFRRILHPFRPRGESRLFHAEKYVQKLLAVLPKGERVDSCFVSSDDYSAINEMRASLQQYGVFCTLYSLTDPSQVGHNRWHKVSGKQSIHFFAELNVMMRTTYFVGTFNSNVGLFVAAMRNCDPTRDDRTHYARSYGVDRDAFYLE